MYFLKSNMVFMDSSVFITLQAVLKFRLLCLIDFHQE